MGVSIIQSCLKIVNITLCVDIISFVRQALMRRRKIEVEQRWIEQKIYGNDGRKHMSALAETSFFIIHFNKHIVVSQ